MKVLMINVVCGIRSTGRICTDLATALEKQGHEVKIAYGREDVPKQFEKYAVRIGTDFDVKMHGVKARLFDGAGFGSKSATIKFIRWVKEYDPDVIHLHNLHGYYINIEVLFNYLKTCGKKIIWTLHDCWAFTGHCSHYMSIECDKWMTLCENCKQLREYPKCIGMGKVSQNYIRKREAFCGIPNLEIVVPSKWLKDEVKKSYLKNYPVKVSYNQIDKNVFKPTDSDLRRKFTLQNKIVILGVASSWSAKKGLYDFYKLSDELSTKYVIVLVGLTKKQIKRAPKKIVTIERINNTEELAQIYTMADVFVNPTYEDNYPTVCLEAQACGLPVITYDVGGCKETLYLEESCIVKKGVENIKNKILEKYEWS